MSVFSAPQFHDPEVTRLAQAVSAAFDALTIPRVPTLVSFLVLGRNGIGAVQLLAVKAMNGSILRRAAVGSRLVAVVDLTTLVDRQGSFEQTVTVSDQIKQLDVANLSAKKLLIVVAS